jgi:hypothetical protein
VLWLVGIARAFVPHSEGASADKPFATVQSRAYGIAASNKLPVVFLPFLSGHHLAPRSLHGVKVGALILFVKGRPFFMPFKRELGDRAVLLAGVAIGVVVTLSAVLLGYLF